MSLKTIAERSGVSISTVSRVLSGTAKISEAVRARVIEIAREEGYIDSRARSATKGVLKSLTVAAPSALLAPSDTNYVAWTIFNAMREAATLRGIRLDPVISEGAALRAQEVAAPLGQARTDGIVVFFDETPAVIDIVSTLSKPMVLLAGQDPTMRVPSVGIGNRYGAHLGTDYLIRQGHRRIALLTWDGRNTIRQREDGYREAMMRAGLSANILSLASFQPDIAEREIAALARDGAFADTTALFCLADNVALAAIRVLTGMGLRVPQDISVLGFDNAIAGEMATPPLSTVHAPLTAIARAALDELERQVRDSGAADPIRRVELACKIVERHSCAPPAVRKS